MFRTPLGCRGFGASGFRGVWISGWGTQVWVLLGLELQDRRFAGVLEGSGLSAPEAVEGFD